MTSPLILAVPSKGRLKEQVEAWLSDCGLGLSMAGGERGYRADLKGVDNVQVRLLSAGDIAEALVAGEAHLGITGEDLLREQPGDLERRVLLLRALGFGRADLVVAVPKNWLDVECMIDLEEVAHDLLSRTGRRMRVATKYVVQTRSFFARLGIVDYRIVESNGATEGAPAAGTAEIVVDITTSGATLVANGLKTLSDGTILKSQAQLAASLAVGWSADQLVAAEGLLRIIEARAQAHESATLIWPTGQDDEPLMDTLVAQGATRRPNGVIVPVGKIAAAAAVLTQRGIGPVTASRPDFVFDPICRSILALRGQVELN